jgi:hypothetical protein
VGKQSPPTRAAPSLVRGTARRARAPPVRYLRNPLAGANNRAGSKHQGQSIFGLPIARNYWSPAITRGFSPAPTSPFIEWQVTGDERGAALQKADQRPFSGTLRARDLGLTLRHQLNVLRGEAPFLGSRIIGGERAWKTGVTSGMKRLRDR